MKKHIPNALTSCNLICGGIGIIQAFNGEIMLAVSLIWLAGLFDFLDGFSARVLGVSSDIGKQLDSLADMVTFGILPSMVMYLLIMEYTESNLLPYSGLFISVFSAIRLAKFNIDERQTSGFIGLPTPATALFISSLPFILEKPFIANYQHLVVAVLVIFSIVLSLLMIAEVPLLALKFKNFTWASNKTRYIFLVFSAILIIGFQIMAIPMIIFTYIIISIVDSRTVKTP